MVRLNCKSDSYLGHHLLLNKGDNMDILCDKIREIRDNLGLDYSDTPTLFFFRDKTLINNYIMDSLKEFVVNNSKGKINKCIENLVLIIYHLLDALVEQGIYPDSIFSLMIFDDLQNIWSDKEKHFDNKGRVIYPNGYEKISGKIDKEIMSMKQGTYQKTDIKLGRHYEDILNYYRLANKRFNEEPSCINPLTVNEYQISICFELSNYYGACDYVEEEAECLIKCLYKVMKLCVEMGINPESYLDELLNKLEKKSLKEKSR